MNAAQMARHVEDLARSRGITVEHYSGGGRAFSRQRKIRIRPVRGVSTYYTALHEIGHLIGRGRSARKLEAEANAWAWAISVALRPPTPSVEAAIGKALRSYLYAGRRNYGMRQNMKEPDEGHEFWKLANPWPLVQRNGYVYPKAWHD